jgi:hypothetical protein
LLSMVAVICKEQPFPHHFIGSINDHGNDALQDTLCPMFLHQLVLACTLVWCVGGTSKKMMLLAWNYNIYYCKAKATKVDDLLLLDSILTGWVSLAERKFRFRLNRVWIDGVEWVESSGSIICEQIAHTWVSRVSKLLTWAICSHAICLWAICSQIDLLWANRQPTFIPDRWIASIAFSARPAVKRKIVNIRVIY